MLEKIAFVALLCTSIKTIYSGVIPIAVTENKGNLEFALKLPSNETVQIGLSFQLLKLNAGLDDTKITTTATTTNSITATPELIPSNSTTAKPKYVTVQEAIEGFRQDLLKKEWDIARIIESERPFYRHFQLQFQDDLLLTIRCTYDSNYQKKSLSISCYEYREYMKERILSDGEVEFIRTQDADYKSDVELIDARSVQQLYTMEIS